MRILNYPVQIMPSSDNSIKNFEKSLQKLELIVQQMENGELNLEDSLEKFEQGIALAKSCQNALSSAKLKVNQLIEENGLPKLTAFDEQTD